MTPVNGGGGCPRPGPPARIPGRPRAGPGSRPGAPSSSPPAAGTHVWGHLRCPGHPCTRLGGFGGPWESLLVSRELQWSLGSFSGPLGISAGPWGDLVAPGEIWWPPGGFSLPQSFPACKAHLFLLFLPQRQCLPPVREARPVSGLAWDLCQPRPGAGPSPSPSPLPGGRFSPGEEPHW